MTTTEAIINWTTNHYWLTFFIIIIIGTSTISAIASIIKSICKIFWKQENKIK